MEGKDQDTEDNNRIINKKLSEYNSIIKENEGIYHRVAKKNGLSDGAFWILYMMCFFISLTTGSRMTVSVSCLRKS